MMNGAKILVSLCATLACMASTAAIAADTRTVERRVAVSPTSMVEISNVSGAVEVYGTDKPEVLVRGMIEAEVERVDVLTDSTRTRVLVVLPRKRNIRNGDAFIEVFVPRGAPLKISTTSADVETRDVSGALEIGTVSGEVRADVKSADVEVKTVSGDVTVRGNEQSGTITVNTVSGNITLDRAAGSFEAVTISGDLEVTLGEATNLRVRTTSGDANVHAKLKRDAKVSLETVSGDLSLVFPAVGGFTTDIESFSGDIGGCMKTSVQRASQYGPGSRLESKVGDGSARIRAKSLSGDIDICDR